MVVHFEEHAGELRIEHASPGARDPGKLHFMNEGHDIFESNRPRILEGVRTAEDPVDIIRAGAAEVQASRSVSISRSSSALRRKGWKCLVYVHAASDQGVSRS